MPTTPKYWQELEELLVECAVGLVNATDVPSTPTYERALHVELTARAPTVARRERFPIAAIAAAGAMVLAFAGFLAWAPADPAPVTAATPGVEITTPVAIGTSADQMVTASILRWMNDRTSEERLDNQSTNQDNDKAFQRLNIAEPE